MTWGRSRTWQASQISPVICATATPFRPFSSCSYFASVRGVDRRALARAFAGEARELRFDLRAFGVECGPGLASARLHFVCQRALGGLQLGRDAVGLFHQDQQTLFDPSLSALAVEISCRRAVYSWLVLTAAL